MEVFESGLTRARDAVFDGEDGVVVDLIQTVAGTEAPLGDCISVAVWVAAASMIASFGCQITGAWTKV